MSRPELNSPVPVILHRMFIFCLILNTIFVVNCSKNDVMAYSQGKCQRIYVPMCRGLPYNETSFPNPLEYETQDEAALEMHQFLPLIQVKCSSNFKLFVCSVYLPVCNGSYRVISPCRSLCQEARQGCEPLLNKNGVAWPEDFDCDHFPATGNCVSENSWPCNEACSFGKAPTYSSSQVTTTQMSTTHRTNQEGTSENSSTRSSVVDVAILLLATCYPTFLSGRL